MSRSQPDSQPPLDIAPHRLAQIRRLTEPEALASEDGRARLRQAIDALGGDEQAVLVSLVWIGRGDFSPAEYDEALSLAFETLGRPPAAGLASAYLLGFDRLREALAQVHVRFGKPP